MHIDKAPLTAVPEHSFEEKWGLAQARYKGTIRTFARNCVRQLPGFELADVEQELLVVLWRCVNNYDPDKGASFNTLFQGSARNRIISLIRTANTKGRQGISVSLSDEAVSAAVDDIMNELGTEERCMLRDELREYVSEVGAEAFVSALVAGRRGPKPKRRVA